MNFTARTINCTNAYCPERYGWPRSPRGLATQLKRQQPALAQLGLQLTFEGERTREGYYVRVATQAHIATQAKQYRAASQAFAAEQTTKEESVREHVNL